MEYAMMKKKPDVSNVLDREELRLAVIRGTIDRDCQLIISKKVTREEALALIEKNREELRPLLSDRMYVYDLVIVPRFHRLIEQFLPITE
jgi:hypothetical protein